jgi:hypothetical protein
MPSFNPSQLNPQVRNANMSVILVGDQAIAFAQTVSHSLELGVEGLYGIGSAKPQEIQQLKDSMQITIDNFDLTSNGMALIQASLVPLSSLISNNSFNISVVDGITNQALYTYVGCVATNFSQNISSNQPITDAITFHALDVLDATGQSVLNGPNALTLTN